MCPQGTSKVECVDRDREERVIDGCTAVKVYFVQRLYSYWVKVNEETELILARTLLVQATGQYLVNERDSQADYRVLEANIIEESRSALPENEG